MPRGSQLARQWRLFQLLDAPAGVTVEDAAQGKRKLRRPARPDLLEPDSDTGRPIATSLGALHRLGSIPSGED